MVTPRRPCPRRGKRDPGYQAALDDWRGRLADIPRGEGWHPKGTQFERIKSGFLALHKYRCGICGCYGSPTSGLAIDHVVPLSECAVQGIDPMDTRNWQPAHHSKPCPYCSEMAGRPIRCNQLRGNLSIIAARQKLANLVGQPVMGVAPSKGRPRQKSAPAVGERPW